MQMYHTKATALENLPVGVPPITLLCRTFRVANTNGKKMIVSGKTLDYCIVDIGPPPTGQLVPFDAYVVQPWSQYVTSAS